MLKKFTLSLVLISLFFLLTFSLIKNLQYPLIWGDEAETAMYSQRIMEYGYPKVHDGKNSLNLAMISGKSTGVREEIDAGIVSLWGQYYFGTMGEYFASQVDDFYNKTFLLRLPHTLIGLLGVMILPFSFAYLFKDRIKSRYFFWMFYLILQILSVPLLLHFREVRSYALTVFFSALCFKIFLDYFSKTASRLSYLKYTILLSVSLLLLLNCFPPGYLAMMLTLGAYLFWDRVILPKVKNESIVSVASIDLRKDKPGFWKLVLPLIIAGVITLPISFFFENSQTAANSYRDISYGLNTYLNYLLRIVSFHSVYHFLYLGIISKVFAWVLYNLSYKNGTIKEAKNGNFLLNLMRISNFFSFYFVVYSVSIATTPFLFDRYFVILQPVLSLVIILDTMAVLTMISNLKNKDSKLNALTSFYFCLGVALIISLITKMDIYTGRIYELTHRYSGPSDFVVDYLKENFSHPEDLFILTNIEQTTFMYYLNSQVFCDAGSDCFDKQPDIILPRRYLLSQSFIDQVNSYLEKGNYKQVFLPVADYPVNNIPEFSLPLRHLFKTPASDNPDEQLIIYVNQDSKYK